MHTFFQEKIDTAIITLSAEESGHCARVLRLKAGQQIAVTNGRGTLATATLLEVSPKATTATITEQKNFPARPFQLHMAVAPTKNIDRFEWFLEKATECGIDQITPLICEQSERKILKPARLHKILVAAMKQSQRVYLPLLNEAISFKDFMGQYNGQPAAFMAHCDAGHKMPLHQACKPGSDVLILIGPEGDFSPQEIALAQDKGVQAISLGNHRLRTETAALAACIEINFLNGLL